MNDMIPRPLQPLLGTDVSAELPTPVPLDLAELPIVLSAKAPRYNQNGALASEFVLTEGDLKTGGDRMHYEIRSANPAIPRAYGGDSEVLYAVMQMIVDSEAWNQGGIGRLDRVPFVRFAELLGKQPSGAFNDRIRDSLTRLANVTVVTQIHEPEDGEDVLSGRAEPVAPRRRTKRVESTLHLMSVSFTREESAIDYIQVDPTWIYQAAGGWTAWIDLPRYVRQTSPIAQRLYSLAAVQCARGRDEWSYTQDQLVELCALSRATPGPDLRRMLKAAHEALVQEGILLPSTPVKERAGVYRFPMAAGPVLRTARMLRGAGMTDLRDTRVQLILLGAIGISGADARRIVTEAPEDAYWALYYYRWTSETQPETEQIHNPARFLMWALKEGRNLSSDERFYRWFRSQLEEREQATAPSALPPQVPPPSGETAPLPDDLWGDALRRYRDRIPANMFEAWLRPTRLREQEVGRIVVEVKDSFAAKWIEDKYHADLQHILGGLTDGPVSLVLTAAGD
ncbi:MAG: replication initiator protein A [Gemmatimonadota bacterium]|nr:replication initiator protein A [Gemmatimonadota bacterium]